MRALFTSLPQVGHMFPLVPLAAAFRSAGDDTLVTTPAPEFRSRVVDADLPVAVVGDLGLEEYAQVSVLDGARYPRDADFARSGRGWAALSVRTIPAMCDLVASYRPDLIVSEPAELAGRLAAFRHGVPWVEHSWALPAPSRYTTVAYRELARRGVPGPAPPAATLHPSPPSLWPRPGNGALAMRFLPYHGAAAPAPLPGRVDGSRRILLTFGSLLPKHGSAATGRFLRDLVHELTSDGSQLILGLDPELVPLFAPLPSGVVYAGWVPLDQALADCDLIVHHGGSGTSMSAAALGVPQLIVPQSTDQFTTSVALADHGCAMRFHGRAATPAVIGRAARRLRVDPSYARRATALADQIRRLPGPPHIAEQLRRLCS